jgi:hypothetical protein
MTSCKLNYLPEIITLRLRTSAYELGGDANIQSITLERGSGSYNGGNDL